MFEEYIEQGKHTIYAADAGWLFSVHGVLISVGPRLDIETPS